MKWNKIGCFIVALLLLTLCACARQAKTPLPEVELAAPKSSSMEKALAQRCREVSAAYRDIYRSAEKTEASEGWGRPTVSQAVLEQMEGALLESGCDLLRSNGIYPSYLASADAFSAFWEAVQRQESSRQEILSLSEDGILTCRLFTYDPEGAYFYCMTWDPDSGSPLHYDSARILDWEVTEKGNFYFRIRPAGDKHYEDYTRIRLTPPDTRLYDWNLRCILPVGYLATNLFLTDWSEEDWGDLSFNDLWESLYFLETGRQYMPDGAAYLPQSGQYKIPAAEFEEILLPYFRLDVPALRTLAHFQEAEGYYPWRPLETNDFVSLHFYTCTPGVTQCRDNADGTITLTVEALSTDLKLDCLFAHEVTLRPLKDGGFQYVANKVTRQTEYGLPFCKPRITW